MSKAKPHVLPTSHGTTGSNRLDNHTIPTFTDSEFDVLSDALRIAQQQVIEAVEKLSMVNPNSPTVERLYHQAEQIADLRERIEAR